MPPFGVLHIVADVMDTAPLFLATSTQVDRSPCQDWSRCGLRQGEHGRNAHLLFSWIRWHRVARTPVMIHENVPGFDVDGGLDIFEQLLGDMYHIVHVLAGPEHVGWPCCKRPRVLVACFHKTKIRLLSDPVALFWNVCGLLQFGARLRVRELLLACATDVRQEEVMIANSRRVGLRPWGSLVWSLAGACGSAATAGPWLPAMAARSLEYILTPSEKARLTVYECRWFERTGTVVASELDLACGIGDNPDGGFLSWSAPVFFCSAVGLQQLVRASLANLETKLEIDVATSRRPLAHCQRVFSRHGISSYCQIGKCVRFEWRICAAF